MLRLVVALFLLSVFQGSTYAEQSIIGTWTTESGDCAEDNFKVEITEKGINGYEYACKFLKQLPGNIFRSRCQGEGETWLEDITIVKHANGLLISQNFGEKYKSLPYHKCAAERTSNTVGPTEKSSIKNCHSKNPDLRIRGCSAIIDSKPSENLLADAYDGRCWANVEKARYQDAISDCTKAIEIRPNYVYPYNNLASAYMALHDYDMAIAYLNNAISLKPDFRAALKNRALAHKSSGNRNSAISDYESILRLDPKDISASVELDALRLPSQNNPMPIKVDERVVAASQPYKSIASETLDWVANFKIGEHIVAVSIVIGLIVPIWLFVSNLSARCPICRESNYLSNATDKTLLASVLRSRTYMKTVEERDPRHGGKLVKTLNVPVTEQYSVETWRYNMKCKNCGHQWTVIR